MLVVKQRCFPITLEMDEPIQLELLPPKRKMLEFLGNFDLKNFKPEEVSDVFLAILNNNKSKYVVKSEDVDDNVDIFMMNELLTHYFKWVEDFNKDPN